MSEEVEGEIGSVIQSLKREKAVSFSSFICRAILHGKSPVCSQLFYLQIFIEL